MNPDQIEQAAKANNLNAPRVSKDDLEANIVHTEVVKHVTHSGKVLRWAVLTTRNGFAVTGNPSASVSIENDHVPTGESVAIANAKSALWPLMGYALAEKLTTAKGEEAPAQEPNYPGFADLAPHQQRVVLEHEELTTRIGKLKDFMDGNVYKTLPTVERADLQEQHEAMRIYGDRLLRRISRF